MVLLVLQDYFTAKTVVAHMKLEWLWCMLTNFMFHIDPFDVFKGGIGFAICDLKWALHLSDVVEGTFILHFVLMRIVTLVTLNAMCLSRKI